MPCFCPVRPIPASWGCYNLKEKEFEYEALEKAGVEVSYLPQVSKDFFIAGETKEGIPVMGAIGDNQASFRGSVLSLGDTVPLLQPFLSGFPRCFFHR